MADDAARRSARPIVLSGDHTVLIPTEGKKHVLGLREQGPAARPLRLDQARARLFVVDGAKALQTAIRKIFGPLGVMQRCQIHKRRNITGAPSRTPARAGAGGVKNGNYSQVIRYVIGFAPWPNEVGYG